MVDKETTFSVVRTKLYRPPITENHVQRPDLLDRLNQRRQRPMTLISAPAGYGKTTLASCWLGACDSPGCWVSLNKNDNDLRTFTTYFIAAVETLYLGACRNTQALLNFPDLPSMEALSSSLLSELDRIEQPYMMVLDDYHLIKEDLVHALLAEVLKHPPQSLHLVIASRRDPPLPISKLRAQSLVTEIRTQDLRFNEMEIKTFLLQQLGIQADTDTAAALERKTEGWVTGLRLAALSMRHRGSLDPKLLEPEVDAQYVMEYLFTEVFSQQRPAISRYLLVTAILGRFCGPLCEEMCITGVEPYTCEIGGWEFIDWLKKENMFVIPLDAENRWFRYHYLFQKLLFNQLSRQYSAEQFEALHAQASGWFASKGLIEEALHHALASGDMEKASELVARFGHQLMNDQQWSRLERCLHQLPRDLLERDPAMLILEAWLQHIRQNMSGMATCLEKIEILYDTSPPDTLKNLKHVQGHIEVLRGIKYYMAADGENALAQIGCAREIVPLRHIRARLFADIFQLGAYQIVGDLQTGLKLYQQAMRDCISEEKKYSSAYLANLCFIYWMDADLAILRKTAGSVLQVVKDNRLLETVGFALYFQGIVHYQRNELHSAEEKLAEVINEHYGTSPMNFARSSFALALTYHALRKPSKARKICNAVIADAIRNNNIDRLKDAQAFEAELALTQGRLAVASRWAREYQAKPFRPTYGFYLPQLTLIKILMAEDTTDSRQQAADLLDQLHDFLVSIHNKRFQIDVLALQALLHHTRGEKSAALKKLTAALDLAEPGGFIRPFVDLGPQMVDLLKRLASENVAVRYIGRILAAFSSDERGASVDESDHPVTHPSYLSTQPLVEPLTNREHEILELLAQRLRNKEIAAKLFISAETVKKHLNKTYGKLNVTSRRQAVEKAQALGILSRG